MVDERRAHAGRITVRGVLRAAGVADEVADTVKERLAAADSYRRKAQTNAASLCRRFR